ncbi:hypothetical protein BCR34DRAFT_330436 [Clohesyomyces aquaticus]|uniref:LCCL domain-containing protein n=1 Tax=Clohesyomyces aquaticus TaxID=1231657 RepID=A0A1Y1ZLY1_9PLEO|nr:hypothetical protein BCR34DRAFT_330436 [Clohesyomyces aquaticus]
MTQSDMRSKSPEPTTVDLEYGDGPTHNPPVRATDEPSSETHAGTPEINGSQPWSRLEKFRLSHPVAKKLHGVVQWFQGPEPHTTYCIRPIFERVQTVPLRLLHRLPKAARAGVLLVTFGLWVALFVVVISRFSLPKDIAGFGAPVRLACTARLWPDPQSCGLDGRNCLPFANQSFAFSCPADCGRSQVLNPRTIGNEQIIYQPLVVGGTPDATEDEQPVYRGDSFICVAAIHSGLLSNKNGGCGVLSLDGERGSYGSVERHSIPSVGFPSTFPMSFSFNQEKRAVDSASQCRDPRWNLLTISTIFTVIISLFTGHPATFFFPIFIIIYCQISLASDAPYFGDYPSAVSTAIGNFLPAAFVAGFIYHFCIRKTLKNLDAQIDKTILWVGGCWVGALTNITMNKIPIQRLLPQDVNQQKGGVAALVVIILVLLLAALYQAWCFRKEGTLPRYLTLYAIFGVTLLVLLAIPGFSLRIHHYILALLLLPGTALQTRPSLLYQGLLVGLFINGIARWGFAPILQTKAALQGDALLGRAIPDILAPVINSTNITFSWDGLAPGYEGVSVLVNDVERFRGAHVGVDNSFTWQRHAMDAPEFFRFGFVRYSSFGGISYSDFTRAGIWQANGSWTDIPPGAT